MKMVDDIADFLGLSKKEEPAAETAETEEGSEESTVVETDAETDKTENENEDIQESEESEETIETTETEKSGEVVETDETDEEIEEEETDPVKILENQNTALLKRLEELEGKVPAKKEESAEEETTPEAVSFLADDDDIDAVLNDKTKLNALLVSVYQKAVEAIGPVAQSSSPNAVIEQVEKYMTLKGGIDEFFQANEDLLPVRKTVGAITNEVVEEHGDWSLKQVLKEAEKRTRESLGIKKKVKVDSKRNPALIDKGSSRKAGSDSRTKVQKDIDDLIS